MKYEMAMHLKRLKLTKEHKSKIFTSWIVFMMIFSFLSVFLIVEQEHASAWWNPDWDKSLIITINYALVETPLVDFPVLVVINSTIAADCDGGNSVRFLAMDNTTEYDFEIEQWNDTGNSYLWVEIPSVSNTTDTRFMLYYDNPVAVDGQDVAGTWNSNYVAVYHMTGDADDSTSNSNDGSISGASSSTTAMAGTSYSFDGNNDYIEVTDSASLDLTTAYTVEIWGNPDDPFSSSSNTTMGLIDKGTYNLFLDQSSGKLGTEIVSDVTAGWTKVLDNGDKSMKGLTVYNGKIYVAESVNAKVHSSSTGDLGSWSLVLDKNSEWMSSMAVYNGNLYVGISNGAGGDDGDIWAYNSGNNTWWRAYQYVGATGGLISGMCVFKGNLYYGRGYTGTDIYYYDGVTWENLAYHNGAAEGTFFGRYNNSLFAGAVGGANVGDVFTSSIGTGSWTMSDDTSYTHRAGLVTYHHLLLSGCGYAADKNDIRSFDGSAWSLWYDGSGLSSVFSLTAYAGRLYFITGGTDGLGDVYYTETGASATKDVDMPGVGTWNALAIFDGDLYAGNEHGSGDGDIYKKDAGNGVSGTTTSWDGGSWKYLVATYDKTDMKVWHNTTEIGTEAYAQTIGTNTYNMYIGELIGGRSWGIGNHNFDGYLDEVRISNSARNDSWKTATFHSINQTTGFITLGDPMSPVRTITVANENPTDASINIPIATASLSVLVNHSLGDLMTITIEMDGQVPATWNNVANGTRTFVLTTTPLSFGTLYTWYVNVTDGWIWQNETFTFTTIVNSPPEFTNPVPANGTTGVSRSTINFTINISDPDGNTFNWTIQTSIGDNSNANGATDGTKVDPLTVFLPASTNVTVWVNATDQWGGTNHSTYWFITAANQPPVISNPSPLNTAFNKSITTNHVSAYISEPEDDYPMTYYITLVNTGETTTGGTGIDTTITLPIAGPLQYTTTYTWWVNVSDSLGAWTNQSFTFSTTVNASDWIDLPQLSDVDMAQWGFYAWVYVLGSWFWGGFFGVLGAALFIKTENAAVTAAWFLAIGIITMAVWPMDMIYMIGILAGVILGFMFAALIIER